MDEYITKINSLFSEALIEYLKANPSQEVLGYSFEIERPVKVYPISNLDPFKLRELVSGKELNVDFKGTVLIRQKLEDGSRQRNLQFVCRNCSIKYDINYEDFEIKPIDDFILISI